MTAGRKIPALVRERGFTLLETMIVIGLTTLIAVGIVAGLLEGLDTLETLTNTQSVEFGHQRAMSSFMKDVQAATWFYNGTVNAEGGGLALRDTVSPFELTLGYSGPDGVETWVRYRTRPGVFSGETYLMRTVVTSDGLNQGTSIMSTGVAGIEFSLLDENGEFTDRFPKARQIIMTLSVNIGGSTVRREYDVFMRNPSLGMKEPPGDFDDIENAFFKK